MCIYRAQKAKWPIISSERILASANKRPTQKGKDLTLIPTALLQLIRRTHCDSKSVEKGTILIGCSN